MPRRAAPATMTARAPPLSCPRSYVFRVANKDMTYAKQLKDYEQAVIQKRFDELSTDEVDALMGEIYPDKEAAAPKK